ncbi:hypothetical protein DFH08DRAFT_951443 [Mycena albidolilacea]|uniref:eIF3a PCI domain-containing protein n=1 Tax=Mycena albidolilacea TaxID=1033008 RepID=A0AAD7AJH6_9AGAR|nr:hypothetical protein DFH08DRAFT_951443 [Mycena albidolilacea]
MRTPELRLLAVFRVEEHAGVASGCMRCTCDAKRLTGHFLLSALAVPVGLTSSSSAQNQSAASGSGTQNTGASAAETRLTTLLGLSTLPTHASLFSSALAAGVLKLAPKPIQQLYEVLEVRFLALCGEVAPILAELAAHNAEGKQGEWPYVATLQRTVLSRLMSQLAQVYASVHIAFRAHRKQDVTPQAAVHFFDPEQVESYIMGSARRGELAVRVDHAEGSIAFVDEAFGGVLEGSAFASSSSFSSSAGGTDATIQPSATELVRTHLGSVARCLHNAVEAISPPSLLPSPEDDAEQQNAALKALTTAVHAEWCELLSELAVRKEGGTPCGQARAGGEGYYERNVSGTTWRAHKLQRTFMKPLMAKGLAEWEGPGTCARRLGQELQGGHRGGDFRGTRRREYERVVRIQAEVKAADAEKYRVRLIEQGIMTGQAAQSMGALDTESIIGLQVTQLEKKKEVAERLRIVAKRDYAQQQAADREAFAAVQGARRDAARCAHEEDSEMKKRLAWMVGEYEARRAVIVAKKGEEYAKKKDVAGKVVFADGVAAGCARTVVPVQLPAYADMGEARNTVCSLNMRNCTSGECAALVGLVIM